MATDDVPADHGAPVGYIEIKRRLATLRYQTDSADHAHITVKPPILREVPPLVLHERLPGAVLRADRGTACLPVRRLRGMRRVRHRLRPGLRHVDDAEGPVRGPLRLRLSRRSSFGGTAVRVEAQLQATRSRSERSRVPYADVGVRARTGLPLPLPAPSGPGTDRRRRPGVDPTRRRAPRRRPDGERQDRRGAGSTDRARGGGRPPDPLPGANARPGGPGPRRGPGDLPPPRPPDPRDGAPGAPAPVLPSGGGPRDEGGDRRGAREAVRRPQAGDRTVVRRGRDDRTVDRASRGGAGRPHRPRRVRVLCARPPDGHRGTRRQVRAEASVARRVRVVQPGRRTSAPTNSRRNSPGELVSSRRRIRSSSTRTSAARSSTGWASAPTGSTSSWTRPTT